MLEQTREVSYMSRRRVPCKLSEALMPVQEVARRMPGALLVVLLGITIAIIQYPSVLRTLRFGPSMPQLVWPTWDEWKKGAVLVPSFTDQGVMPLSQSQERPEPRYLQRRDTLS